MFFWQNKMAHYVLHLVDILLAILGFALAYTIKSHYLGSYSGLSAEPNYYLILLLFLFFYNFTLNHFHYNIPVLIGSRFRELVKSSAIVGISNTMLILSMYTLHQPEISRLFMALYATIVVTFLLVRRGIISHYIRTSKIDGNNEIRILIIGSRERAKETIRTIFTATENNYKIVGCMEIDPVYTGNQVEEGVQVIGDMRQFKSVLLNQVIDEVIFAVPLKQVEHVNDQIAFAEKIGVKVRIMPDWQLQKIMFRPETATIAFENFIGIPTLALSSTPKKDLEMLVKSFVDYLAAFLGILAISPLLLAIALLIKLSSPGPVFFHQVRSGLNGRKFKLYKFRTMVVNAEALRGELEQQNEMDGPVFKIARDPRITPIGHFLRKTSLDELPQLFNILKGEMSMVGPRPPIPDEVEEYLPCQRRRLSMKPGLTCIWQVSGKRNDITFDNWMKMDLKYIDNWCLLLDLKLLLRTVSVVLLGAGR